MILKCIFDLGREFLIGSADMFNHKLSCQLPFGISDFTIELSWKNDFGQYFQKKRNSVLYCYKFKQ